MPQLTNHTDWLIYANSLGISSWTAKQWLYQEETFRPLKEQMAQAIRAENWHEVDHIGHQIRMLTK